MYSRGDMNWKLKLNENLGQEAIEILVDHGLHQRNPKACDAWKARKRENKSRHEQAEKDELNATRDKLNADLPEIENCLQLALAERIVTSFPYVYALL